MGFGRGFCFREKGCGALFFVIQYFFFWFDKMNPVGCTSCVGVCLRDMNYERYDMKLDGRKFGKGVVYSFKIMTRILKIWLFQKISKS